MYVELEKADKKAVFTIKNVSKNELDIVSNGNVDLLSTKVTKPVPYTALKDTGKKRCEVVFIGEKA